MVSVRKREEETKKLFVYFDTDYFELKWNKNGLLKFGEKLQKDVDNRKDWQSKLYQEIAKRTKFIKAKDVSLNLDKLEFEETIVRFADECKKVTKLREKPLQKTIKESS